MPIKLKDYLPEKDYAIWLVFGLVLLLINQALVGHSGAWVPIVRWLLVVGALVNYCIVLYHYDRDRRAKKKEKEEGSEEEHHKNSKA